MKFNSLSTFGLPLSLVYLLIFAPPSFADKKSDAATRAAIACNLIYGGGLDPDFEARMLDRQDQVTVAQDRLNDKVRTEGVVATFRNWQIVQAHNDQYSNGLLTGPRSDQGGTGECWDFSGCGLLRTTAFYQNKLPLKFEFSQFYIWKFHFAEQANNHFSRLILDQPTPYLTPVSRTSDVISLSQGGEWESFAYLASKWGLVPKEAMPATLTIQNPQMMLDDLAAQIDYTTKLIKTAKDRHAELNELVQIRDAGNASIHDILTIYLGKTPASFEIKASKLNPAFIPADQKGKKMITFTPQQFARDYLQFNPDDYVAIGSYPLAPYRKRVLSPSILQQDHMTYYDVEFLNLPKGRLSELTVASIDQKMPVWFAAEVRSGIDNKNGILHPQIFDRSKLYDMNPQEYARRFTAKERSYFGLSAADHAMVIQGYDRDPVTGKILKYKVENSWGKEVGDDGIYGMYPQFFQQNLFEVVVKKSLLNEKELKLLESKPYLITPENPYAQP